MNYYYIGNRNVKTNADDYQKKKLFSSSKNKLYSNIFIIAFMSTVKSFDYFLLFLFFYIIAIVVINAGKWYPLRFTFQNEGFKDDFTIKLLIPSCIFA